MREADLFAGFGSVALDGNGIAGIRWLNRPSPESVTPETPGTALNFSSQILIEQRNGCVFIAGGRGRTAEKMSREELKPRFDAG